MVVVLDPDLQKEYLDRVQNRSKEKKYAYDVAFGAEARNVVICQLFELYYRLSHLLFRSAVLILYNVVNQIS